MRLARFIALAATLTWALNAHTVVAGSINVVMKTSAGDITLELYPDAAPLTVENFLKYVDGNFYDDKSSFYRVVHKENQAQNKIKIEVIQGGLGMEAPGLPFDPVVHETTKQSGILHKDGVISMGRMEPGSATSEFFISINDQPELDFGGERYPDGQGFAAFGKVISGMDVVRRIQEMKTDTPAGELEYTSGQMLLEPVVIWEVSRSSD